MKTITISVRSLIESLIPRGDLTAGWLTNKRAMEGQKGHLQAAKDNPEAQPELSIKLVINYHPLILNLQGRMDLFYPDSHCIEEVKTTFSLSAIKEPEEIHLFQLYLYGYLYSKLYRPEKLTLKLSYIDLNTNQYKHFEFDDPAIYMKQAEDLLYRFLRLQWEHHCWQETRNKSLTEMSFPFSQFRPYQREMAAQAYSSLKGGRSILIEAPTGIGKTMGFLFPALKVLGEKKQDKLFYFTSKGTQKGEVLQSIQMLLNKNIKFRSIVITAKQKACLFPDNYCRPETCPFAIGYYSRLHNALESFKSELMFSPEVLERLAIKHSLCPFELSLDLSLQCDLIICDYNYLFDPRVYLKRFFLQKNRPYYFLIEEAHNLISRVREMHKPQLQKKAFLELSKMARTFSVPSLQKAGNKGNKIFLDLLKRIPEEGYHVINESQKEWLRNLKNLRDILTDSLSKALPNELYEKTKELTESIFYFVKVLELVKEDFQWHLQRKKRSTILKLYLLDTSRIIQQKCGLGSGTVFFSASLRPQAYFCSFLGVSPNRFYSTPAPFPQENQLTLRVTHLSMRYRDRSRTLASIAEYLISFVQGKTGHYLFFFPSYKYLEAMAPILKERLPNAEILQQKTGMEEIHREDFLQSFHQHKGTTKVGLAVLGGIFGEAIDLRGEKLIGVAILGAGLSQLNPEENLLAESFGFETAYSYPGINRMIQGGGRLIRSSIDKGALLLIDHRLDLPLYRRTLPANWYIHPSINNVESMVQFCKRFWQD